MPNNLVPDDRIPVIVGVGEIVDRPKEISKGLEPLVLLEQALKRAEADSGDKLLGEIQSLDIVNFLSWRYRDPEIRLSEKLGITPAHCYYGPVGGESPIRYIHEAAKRIARGECAVAAVCGAEAQSTVTKAERAGAKLPWTPFAHDVEEPKRGAAFQKPLAVKLGVFRPITVYPFYEAASSAHWGQTPREAMAESGALWSTYSNVASQNPNAWLKRRFTADEITTPTPENRLIAWPYTKLQVANPTVNMGAAVLMTSLAKARAAGIAEDRLFFRLGGGLGGEAPGYFVPGQVFLRPPPKTLLQPGLGKLRSGANFGLLYGQGGFVTKHHALVLSRQAPRGALAQDTSVQTEADRHRRAVPEFVTEANGKGEVESFTVIYGRNGEAEHGVVMLRTQDNARALARVPASDDQTLAHLLH